MRLGVVGLGMIGRTILRAADEGRVPVSVPAVAVRDKAKAAAFLKTLRTPPPLADLEGVVEASEAVLEAAGGPMVEPICRAALSRGRDVIVLSAGALLEREDLVALARESGARIHVPSGAIIGLDGLKGAAEGRVDAITMTTRKPPKGLKGAPYVVERGIDLDAIREPTVIFEGSPVEGCKGFPENVNVSAAVSLAGIGPRRTTLRIVCEPGLTRNVHEVEAVGEFGRSFIRIENVPTENPKTGILTYLSTLAFLRGRAAPLSVGT